MTEMQLKTRKLRLALICIGLVALLGLSIYSAHLLLNKPYLFVQEDFHPVVLPNTPAPTYQTPTLSRSPRRLTTYRPSTTYRPVSRTTMRSTAPMRVYQTSSSSVHHIGGGNSGSFGMGNMGSSSSTPRGIMTSGSTSAFTGMIYMTTPHNALTSVGAGYAEEVVNEKMGIVSRRMRAEDGWSDENDGPVLDPPNMVPVGATPWVVMLLLVIGYQLWRRKRMPRSERSI